MAPEIYNHSSAILKPNMSGRNAQRRAEQPSGTIPPPKHDGRGKIDARIVSLAAPDSFEAEQYRRLRYVLEEKRVETDGIVVLVCSPASGDGKSLTAINLAGTLAQDSAVRVLLLDTDVRRRSESLTSTHLVPERVSGLTELMANPQRDLQGMLYTAGPRNLFIMPAGMEKVTPYETFRSERFFRIISEARQQYDYVIIDAPPVVPVSDCKIIVPLVDWYIMVVAAHKTPRSMLEEALNIMPPEKALGLVFNRSDVPPRYYGYYSYYGPRRKNHTRWKIWARP